MQLSSAQSIRELLYRDVGWTSRDASPTARGDQLLRAISRVAFLCLAVFCLCGAVVVVVGSARMIPNPAENTTPENANVYDAVIAARTGQIYTSPEHPPYAFQPFGPLFYMVDASIARASHLDIVLTRQRIRLLTYGCFLLCGVVIFLICRVAGCSMVLSILAPLMMFGQPDFLRWNTTVRPDMLFLVFMLLSLLCAIEGGALGGALYALSGVLAAAAFLVKPPGIAVSAAIVAVLLWNRKFRSALMFAVSAALPVLVVFAILLSRHGPFWEQFTSPSHYLWSLKDGASFAFAELADIVILIPIALGVFGFSEAIAEGMVPQMIAAFAAVNWAVGMSGLPQLGADINYFLPGLAGCALLLPFAIRMIRKNLRMRLAYVLAIAALVSATYMETGQLARLTTLRFRQSDTTFAALAPFKILSNNALFTIHGRDPELLDPFTGHHMELQGYWNSEPIVREIDRGAFDLVILWPGGDWHTVTSYRGVSYFSPQVLDAINKNYEVFCSSLWKAVLKPRSRPVNITPAALEPILGRCSNDLAGRPPQLREAPLAR